VKHRRGWRELQIGGRRLRWRCSRIGIVEIREGRRVVARTDCCELIGVTFDDWDRARWKGGGYTITPSHVAGYLEARPRSGSLCR
jgi:hypothetical protein